MAKKDSQHIKSRTSLEFKKEVEDYAKNHNVSISNLIISSLQICMKEENASTLNKDNKTLYELKLNLVRNKLMNIINLDCNIPEHTKKKIRKELDKIG